VRDDFARGAVAQVGGILRDRAGARVAGHRPKRGGEPLPARRIAARGGDGRLRIEQQALDRDRIEAAVRSDDAERGERVAKRGDRRVGRCGQDHARRHLGENGADLGQERRRIRARARTGLDNPPVPNGAEGLRLVQHQPRVRCGRGERGIPGSDRQ
jgi:hypothetical protein